MKNVLILLLFLKNSIGYSQPIDTTIRWDIDIILDRDPYGKIYNEDYFAIYSTITSLTDSHRLIIFDYNEISIPQTLDFYCEKKIELYKKEVLNSQILIENDVGCLTPLAENGLEHFKFMAGLRVQRYSYFNIIPVDDSTPGFLMHNAYPLHWLTSCGNTTKIRLHYIYKVNEKYAKFSPNPFHIISNWVDLDSIR
jgi:hypothetical protein